MSNEKSSIGANIRGLRKAKGLNQRQLGESIKVASATISDWEVGKANPSAAALKLLAAALECSPFELLGVNPAGIDALRDREDKERLTGTPANLSLEERLAVKFYEEREPDYMPIIQNALKSDLYRDVLENVASYVLASNARRKAQASIIDGHYSSDEKDDDTLLDEKLADGLAQETLMLKAARMDAVKAFEEFLDKYYPGKTTY